MARHYTLVRALYMTFYLSVVFMVVSGLCLVFEDDLKIPDNVGSQIHDVHEIFKWYFYAFVALHILGVAAGELGKFKGIVSNMIHGGDDRL